MLELLLSNDALIAKAIVGAIGFATAWIAKRPKANALTTKSLNLTGEGSEAILEWVKVISDKNRSVSQVEKAMAESKDFISAIKNLKG